jgi:hypothetical protein
MAFIDNLFDWGSTAISSSTADTVSANVMDYATASNYFGGPVSLKFKITMALSGATGTISARARFVGADNAALSTNPEILADTGVELNQDDGATALVAASVVRRTLIPGGSIVPKRFYGFIFTLGGTTPSATCTVATVLDDQTSMPYAKAATP